MVGFAGATQSSKRHSHASSKGGHQSRRSSHSRAQTRRQGPPEDIGRGHHRVAAPLVGALPHLLPGRYTDFKTPLLHPNATDPNFFKELPTNECSNRLNRHLSVERIRKDHIYRPKNVPELFISGAGEYRHENIATHSSREDPSLWPWGDMKRSRQNKKFYDSYLNDNKVVPLPKPRYYKGGEPLPQRCGDDNRFHRIAENWHEQMRQSDALRSRKFGRQFHDERVRKRLIDNSNMFVLMKQLTYKKSTRPRTCTKPAPKTPTHFLW